MRAQPCNIVCQWQFTIKFLPGESVSDGVVILGCGSPDVIETESEFEVASVTEFAFESEDEMFL